MVPSGKIPTTSFSTNALRAAIKALAIDLGLEPIKIESKELASQRLSALEKLPSSTTNRTFLGSNHKIKIPSIQD
jgi:hypothetical protein